MIIPAVKRICVSLCVIPQFIFPCLKNYNDLHLKAFEHYFQGTSSYYKMQIKKAVSEYRKVLSYYPKSAAVYSNIAHLYEESGNYDKAVSSYKKSLELEPDNIYRLLNLAQVYRSSGRPKTAIKVYNEALEDIAGNNSDAMFEFHARIGLAYSLLDIDKENDALAEFTKVTEKYPKQSLGYLELARLLEKRDVKKSIEAYKKALYYDHSLSFINLSLAKLYKKDHCFPLAYSRYTAALNIDPDNENIIEERKIVASKIPDYLESLGRKADLNMEEEIPPAVEPVKDENVPVIKVGLAEHVNSVFFKCGSTLHVKYNPDSEILFTISENTVFKILKIKKAGRKETAKFAIYSREGEEIFVFDKPLLLIQEKNTASFTVFDVKYGTGYFFAGIENRSYRGNIEIIPDSGAFTIVNAVKLEEYLYGVLPGEIEESWNKEALKAQAISARTYALIRKGWHDKFDVCSTVHCAVYKGVKAEQKVFNDAVNDTKGLVLSKDGKLVPAFYHDNCGGHTRTALDTWGCKLSPDVENTMDSNNAADYCFPMTPEAFDRWIKYYPDVFCNAPSCALPVHFRWVKKFTKKELEKTVKKYKNIGNLLDVKISSRSYDGYVQSVTIYGSKRDIELKGSRVRGVFKNLRSSLFKIVKKINDSGKITEFIFYGGGWGHGVGMCQTGVASMAEKGYKCENILLHYFPNSQIANYYEDEVCWKYFID